MPFSFLLAAVLGASLTPPVTDPLGLAEAVHIAQSQDDPSSAQFGAMAESQRHRAAAAAVLPDPTLGAAITGLPLATLDPEGEPMTQLRLSVRQMFPRGDTLRLSSQERLAQAAADEARRDLAEREIVRDVRLAWLEAHYWDRAEHLTRLRIDTVAELTGVALSAYSAGQQNGHDVIRSELESLVLENRLREIARHRETALAELERYVGPGAARRPIAPQSPRLPHIAEVDRLESGLTRHPAVAVADAAIREREVRVDLALQEYRPAWGVEAGYGLRGGRSDVASIGVSVEMPLFERRRQDEGVAAARDEVAAGELARQALLLDMRRSLVIEVSRLDRLTEQEVHQRDAVLPAARDTREAVLEAYQNDVADFPELVRAELALLDAELALQRLETDRNAATARILFLAGDVQ